MNSVTTNYRKNSNNFATDSWVYIYNVIVEIPNQQVTLARWPASIHRDEWVTYSGFEKLRMKWNNKCKNLLNRKK